MQTLLTLLQVVAPLYLLMLTGRMARAAGMLADQTRKQINGLVFYVFAPALIIRIITAKETLNGIPWLLILLHVLLLTAFAMALMLLLKRTAPEFQGTFTQAAYRSNMVFFGLPTLTLVYGPDQLSAAIPVILLFSMIFFNISSVIVLSLPHHNLGQKFQPLKLAIGIAKNPLILACVIGFAMAMFKLPQSKWLAKSIDMLAVIAAPLALIELGSGLEFGHLSAVFGRAGLCSLLKLIILPALYWLLLPLFGQSGQTLDSLVILTACPTAVLSYLMAHQMKGDSKLASEIIVVSSALSLVTIPIWLWILGLGG